MARGGPGRRGMEGARTLGTRVVRSGLLLPVRRRRRLGSGGIRERHVRDIDGDDTVIRGLVLVRGRTV